MKKLHRDEYKKLTREEITERLSDIQKRVTLDNGTEPPFHNEYNDNHEEGIYVDLYTGDVLFTSLDKFDSGCGWPAFSKPFSEDSVNEKNDFSHGMFRTEVRSEFSDAHLGHVFTDGPKELGGLRYCINSAAIDFIPREEMEERGYGEYLYIFNDGEK